MADAEPKLRELFSKAAECRSAEEQAAYLDQACQGNAELRARVEELLQAHREAGSFLQEPSASRAATSDLPSPVERPGTVIGPYKLLQQIGEGGMGVVWMAEQTQPVQRKVALKLIKPGMDSRQVVARFEAERQALAMMDHVNIARVFDGGATENGLPYFVMELVHGVPITRYCDDNHLTPRERLELFVPVCQAIQHAHQKGIIHRDIKPSNVMVTLYDGKPVPKVIDFGVAKATEQKLTERTLFTQYGTMVGTLEYMSPEQAEMSALGVDTRSDIYSLGVLLYELLTGNTPLTHKTMKEAAYAEILRMIKEEEPPRPSTRLTDSGEALASISANRHTEPAKLTKLVRGELDWIVMKCLEKDRNRRYETSKEFAADVQRYLDDEPVQACPPSAGYRFRKFARRNKAAFAAGSAAVLVVLLALVGLAVSNVHITRERNEKAAALEQARLNEEATGRQLLRTEKALSLALNAMDQLVISYYMRYDDLTLHPFLLPGDWDQSRAKIGIYEQLTQCNPEPMAAGYGTAEAFEVLGFAHLELGEFAAAEQNVRTAITLLERLATEHHAPDYRAALADSYLGLGDVLEKTGRMSEAEQAYRELIRLSSELQQQPGSWQFWQSRIPVEPYHRTQLTCGYTALGRLLHRSGRLAEAEAAYRQALVWADGQWSMYEGFTVPRTKILSGLGSLFDVTGRSAEAEEMFRDVCHRWETKLAGSPRDRHILWNMALAEKRLGDFLSRAGRAPEAADAYRRALKIWENLIKVYPPVPEYPRQLAWFLVTCPEEEFRDPARAVPLAAKAVELAPKDGRNWTTLAAVHYRGGNLKGSQGALDKAMELRNGGDAYDRLFQAMVRWRMGEKHDARKACDRAIGWMEKHGQDDTDLRHLRTEAEKVIGKR